MNNPNKHGPCIDKNCSWCCSPVKIDARSVTRGLILPKDPKGNDLWIKRDQLLASKNASDTSRINTYDCVNFDADTGMCKDYDNRPNICRSSSCVDLNSAISVDDQHSTVTNKEFIKIHKA